MCCLSHFFINHYDTWAWNSDCRRWRLARRAWRGWPSRSWRGWRGPRRPSPAPGPGPRMPACQSSWDCCQAMIYSQQILKRLLLMLTIFWSGIFHPHYLLEASPILKGLEMIGVCVFTCPLFYFWVCSYVYMNVCNVCMAWYLHSKWIKKGVTEI